MKLRNACHRCQRHIAWGTTPAGKKIPLVPHPDPDGKIHVSLVQVGNLPPKLLAVELEHETQVLEVLASNPNATFYNRHVCGVA